MTVPAETLQRIRANAERVIGKLGPLSGLNFGYDRDSVAWVQGFIERYRNGSEDDPGTMISVLGSYLGEAIISAAGGQWCETEDGLGVKFDNGDTGFPFGKVSKQFEQGLEGGESILSFYDLSVEYVATGKLPATDRS